jgi:hypothetical protein
VDYVWGLACARPTTSEPANEVSGCIAARTCAGTDQELYRLWGRRTTDTAWIPLYTRCFTQLPQTPTARITPALVLEQLRRVGLPELTAHTQPAGTTLVNLETIFYTHAEPFTTTLTLLGQNVDVHAEPVAYHWHHGDGTSTTTTVPGRPYPAKTITHRYQHTQTLHPRVDVTYAARFRVNNGAWQDIDTTLTIPGPQTALTVTEATPQLSGDYS